MYKKLIKSWTFLIIIATNKIKEMSDSDNDRNLSEED